ncbi:MAG: hypothetical protein H7343_09635 [Undibacterium sp.]|nr:hypothetical protein [Opitutaceae bacterium]
MALPRAISRRISRHALGFEALLRQGLEGTAVGTLVMPYCSGLGNLLFVVIVAARKEPPTAILTNCLVNNVTNLTVLLALPALFWGLNLHGEKSSAKKTRAANPPLAPRPPPTPNSASIASPSRSPSSPGCSSPASPGPSPTTAGWTPAMASC